MHLNLSCHAELCNHPDYRYLVEHKGEPSLSLFGGPTADVSSANLLNHFLHNWAADREAHHNNSPSLSPSSNSFALSPSGNSPALSPSSKTACTPFQNCQVGLRQTLLSLPLNLDSAADKVCDASATQLPSDARCSANEQQVSMTAAPSGGLTATAQLGHQQLSSPKANLSERSTSKLVPSVRMGNIRAEHRNSKSVLSGEAVSMATIGAEHRNSKLVPSEEAVRMANIGAEAVPGLSPMEYRQALYQTWMTDEPAGMQYMDWESDTEVQH